MRLTLIMCLIIFSLNPKAQNRVFTEDELVSAIRKYHPVAKQAAIDVSIARTEVTISRGAFDPRVSGQTARKEFAGIDYYDQQATEVSIPTWYGIDVHAGTEKLSGARLNPEETAGRLSYLGFSVQPLQNLVLDKRRATLQQAKILQQLSETERRIAVNDLLLNGLKSYWEWWESYHIHLLMQSALRNAEKRMAFVKTAYALGDRPAIDTVEAYTQIQSIQIRLSEAFLKLTTAQLELNTFLWNENNGQVELPIDVVPQNYQPVGSMDLPELFDLVKTHPELTQYDFKLRNIALDRRLAFQSLLPEVKLKYNQTGYDFSSSLKNGWFDNNYRYGLSFSMPLRLSEGRGKYQQAKLKLARTSLEQANKRIQLETKVRQSFNQWQQAEVQLSLQNEFASNTKTLQRGEEVRFSNGESSLFLVNARELRTIEAEQKQIELKAKVKKAVVAMRWAAGVYAE